MFQDFFIKEVFVFVVGYNIYISLSVILLRMVLLLVETQTRRVPFPSRSWKNPTTFADGGA